MRPPIREGPGRSRPRGRSLTLHPFPAPSASALRPLGPLLSRAGVRRPFRPVCHLPASVAAPWAWRRPWQTRCLVHTRHALVVCYTPLNSNKLLKRLQWGGRGGGGVLSSTAPKSCLSAAQLLIRGRDKAPHFKVGNLYKHFSRGRRKGEAAMQVLEGLWRWR